MSMTDPIADMLTRIRNAGVAGHRKVDLPASRTKKAIAELLMKQGYIAEVKELDEGAQGVIRIQLKYFEIDGKQAGVIEGIRRVSKIGRAHV